MKRIVWVVFFLIIHTYSFAQYSNLKFEKFSTLEGLSSSTCLEVFQDSDGFLWVGTIDGLNKYDGYEFEVFRPILDDANSISSNRVNSITEDFWGNLWLGTANGLNVFISQFSLIHAVRFFVRVSYVRNGKKTKFLEYKR